jgi:type II secretion system protein D
MRILPCLLIPLLAPRLLAQNEEVPAIPGIPQPPAPVKAPIPADAVDADLGDTLIVESIEQLKLSGDDLADLYRKYTGRRVIVASTAAAAEFRFVQPASPQDPLTYREAAELLRKAATIESFIFVPAGDGSKLDYLTLATAGLKPTGIGVKVYTENDPLPEGDAVISYVMPLQYIKPDEAVRTFTQIIGQFGAFGSIAAVPNAASVVITENTSLIRKLIDLKAEIDKPSSQVTSRFINVKYADVTELATTLNELLGQEQGANTTAGIQRTPDNNVNKGPIDAAQTAGVAGSTPSSVETPVQIIPDPRTNRIFGMGRPVDLLFVEGLVREFDIATDQRNFLRRKLKFLSVADFLPIAGDALTRAFNGTGSGGAEGGGANQGQATGGGNRQNAQNTQNNRSQNSSSLFNGGGSQGSGSFGGGGGSGGGSSGSRGSSLSAPDVNTAPESLLIGRTLLVADNITNSIVVQGPPTAVEIIENLLDQVDVKADQVMISTVFGQLALGKSTTTGIDWLRAYRGNENGGLAGSSITGGPVNSVNPTSIVNPITGSAAIPAAGAIPAVAAVIGFPNKTGLSLYGKIGSSLGAYVNLLSTSGDFTLLSRPSIFVKNNQIGTISSGKRIAIPTSSNQFSGNGVSTNVEYRDVVLKLEVIPLVNSEKEITLQIALVSDSLGKSTPIEGLGDIPEINTRELLTTVTVPNNQTIVLGGLITTNDTESVTGIPLLSDIPGLGRLFSTKTKGVDRDELMIFIQPSIVNSNSSLDYVQADMDSRYDVSDPARKFSDGSVLPPLEEIDEKGSSANRSNPPAAVPVAEQPKEKRSIRPLHRR